MPRTKDITQRVRRKETLAEREAKIQKKAAKDREDKANARCLSQTARSSFFSGLRQSPVAGTSSSHSDVNAESADSHAKIAETPEDGFGNRLFFA